MTFCITIYKNIHKTFIFRLFSYIKANTLQSNNLKTCENQKQKRRCFVFLNSLTLDFEAKGPKYVRKKLTLKRFSTFTSITRIMPTVELLFAFLHQIGVLWHKYRRTKYDNKLNKWRSGLHKKCHSFFSFFFLT